MKQISKILLALTIFISAIITLCSCESILGGITGDEPTTECTHVYGDWTVVDGEFCEDRLSQRTCTLCGNIDYREGEEADHYWSDYTTHEPTCINEGYDERVCRLCDKVEKINIVPKTDEHDFIITGRDEPTCTSSGIEYSKCIVCDLAMVETFGEPTGEHDYTRLVAFDEFHTYYCWYCNEENGREAHIYEGDSTICEICGYDPRPAYDITLWVSEMYGVTSLFERQIERFAELYGYRINYTIEGVAEVDAGYLVAADVASAPDIFCFPQDYTNRLYNAGALAAPSPSVADGIIAANDPSSILSASVNGSLQAYPLTSDNGYYMYYDSSVITNPDSLEQIIADCEEAGKKIRFAGNNAWYVASFFIATGCESEWIVDEDGQFVGVNDSYNSEEGLIAMKGLQKLTQSSAYESNADIWDDDTAVWITGIWNHDFAMEHGLSATDLPSFTVDGVTYHMGSFSGNKLMGVKPQENEERAKLLEELALYLTSYECQIERFNEFEYGASNLQAQDEIKKAHFGLAALNKQAEFAIPQGNIHGAWWDIAKMLGIATETAKTEQDLKDALEDYDEAKDKLLILVDEKTVWSVIGDIENTVWDHDFDMNEIGDGIFSTNTLYLEEGEEFKVRKNHSWEVNFGCDGYNQGQNFKVEKSGNYIIKFTYLSDEYSIVELVPVE